MADDFGREFERHRHFIHSRLSKTRLQLVLLIGSGFGGAGWLTACLLSAPRWLYTGAAVTLATGCLLLAQRRPRWKDGSVAAFLDAQWALPATLAAALSADRAHPFRQLLLRQATAELAARQPTAPQSPHGRWYYGPALLLALLLVDAAAPPAAELAGGAHTEASQIRPQAMPNGQRSRTAKAPPREGLQQTRAPSGLGPAQMREFCPTCSRDGGSLAPSTRQALAVAAELLRAHPATASLAEATRAADTAQVRAELAKLNKSASAQQKQAIQRQARLAYEALKYTPAAARASEAQAMADTDWGHSDKSAPLGSIPELEGAPSPATELRPQPLTPALEGGMRVPDAAKRSRHRAEVELSALLRLLRNPLPETGPTAGDSGRLSDSAAGTHPSSESPVNSEPAPHDAPRLSQSTRGMGREPSEHESSVETASEPLSATVALPLHGAAGAERQYWSGSARGTLQPRRRSTQHSPTTRRSEPAAELRGVNAVRVPRSYREQVSRYFSGGG